MSKTTSGKENTMEGISTKSGGYAWVSNTSPTKGPPVCMENTDILFSTWLPESMLTLGILLGIEHHRKAFGLGLYSAPIF
jgi:hypothetical protein